MKFLYVLISTPKDIYYEQAFIKEFSEMNIEKTCRHFKETA